MSRVMISGGRAHGFLRGGDITEEQKIQVCRLLFENRGDTNERLLQRIDRVIGKQVDRKTLRSVGVRCHPDKYILVAQHFTLEEHGIASRRMNNLIEEIDQIRPPPPPEHPDAKTAEDDARSRPTVSVSRLRPLDPRGLRERDLVYWVDPHNELRAAMFMSYDADSRKVTVTAIPRNESEKNSMSHGRASDWITEVEKVYNEVPREYIAYMQANSHLHFYELPFRGWMFSSSKLHTYPCEYLSTHADRVLVQCRYDDVEIAIPFPKLLATWSRFNDAIALARRNDEHDARDRREREQKDAERKEREERERREREAYAAEFGSEWKARPVNASALKTREWVYWGYNTASGLELRAGQFVEIDKSSAVVTFVPRTDVEQEVGVGDIFVWVPSVYQHIPRSYEQRMIDNPNLTVYVENTIGYLWMYPRQVRNARFLRVSPDRKSVVLRYENDRTEQSVPFALVLATWSWRADSEARERRERQAR